MLIDKGFSHAIAKAVLEDSPDNQEAKDILLLPENRLVLDNGVTFNLDEINEDKAIAKGLKGKIARYNAGAQNNCVTPTTRQVFGTDYRR